MSLVLAQAGVEMARCQHCSHDLKVRKQGGKQGFVFCSNSKCRWAKRPHPTNHWVNRGKVVA